MSAVIDYRAQQLWSDALIRRQVPQHLHEGLLHYLVYGILPGHFLRAVIENDLKETFKRGDAYALAGLGNLMAFLFHDAPGTAWGSPDVVRRYQDTFRKSGSPRSVWEQS